MGESFNAPVCGDVLSSVRFEEISDKISPKTYRALEDKGFEKMTQIQAKSIPHLLQGK